MSSELHIGLDIGSVSINTVVYDTSDVLLSDRYDRINGKPLDLTYSIFEDILAAYPHSKITFLSLTGSGGKEIASLLGGVYVNEIIAQSKAICDLLPDARTVIEIGGEDSKLIEFERDAERTRLKDFSMNSLCAAGTGSFLDQQALRFGIGIEEMGDIARRAKSPARIAGRCSVFAKSDMIHLQQIGSSVEDIVAGLCLGFARNFKAIFGKGKTFEKPVVFQGGVAANKGMRWAFEKMLDLQPGELIVPEHFASMGAIGALRYAKEENKSIAFRGTERLRAQTQHTQPLSRTLAPLERNTDAMGNTSETALFSKDGNGDKIDAYLGIDVGSISTCLAVIDKKYNLIAKRYLMTASRPIEAVRRGLAEINAEAGDKIHIIGVGTTGSGRYMVGDLVGADVIHNEITTQARAAVMIDSDVDTIFEIGGQDSKFISLEKGLVVDFEMNKVCAAGTGSFLEEQAQKLNIDIKSEFSTCAFRSKSPVSLGDRCTVFMESDIVHHQQKGAHVEDLLAGLAYSIVENYLNRVVVGKKIGNRILLQGGVAFNKSVVAAFSKVLQKSVIVPPHNEVTGAIGAAILSAEHQNGRSRFKGFSVSERKYSLSSFECKNCPNHCEIKKVALDGDAPLFYGGRCERYETNRKITHIDTGENPFDIREKLLGKNVAPLPHSFASKGKVGIPLCLTLYDLLPFWKTFFDLLGFEVLLSEPTNSGTIKHGVECTSVETCLPIKIAHGHILDLIQRDLDILFLPGIIDFPSKEMGIKDNSRYVCPHVQSLPHTFRAAITLPSDRIQTLSPSLHLQFGDTHVVKELLAYKKELQSSGAEIQRAIREAYHAYYSFKTALQDEGKKALQRITERNETAFVLIGRPYNTCDKGGNLGIVKKIHDLGLRVIPMDMLPLDEIELDPHYKSTYWNYGVSILKAAKFIRENTNLFPIYLTNFACGPDSMLLNFFATEMQGKAVLQLEIDEHSADAGVITRVEAFSDTIKNNGKCKASKEKGRIVVLQKSGKRNRMYVPYICPQIEGPCAAIRRYGYDTVQMKMSDERSHELGKRHTSGKECYPALITVGDMLREIEQCDFAPSRSAFLMATATGPCRFGQYHLLQRNVLDELGYGDIPIVLFHQDGKMRSSLKGIERAFLLEAWRSLVTIDIMYKLLLRTRPYEIHHGDSTALFNGGLNELCRRLEQGKEIDSFLRLFSHRMNHLAVDEKGTKPRIGILGEIYVRSHPFVNDFLIDKIEALGGEALMTPFAEWLNYGSLLVSKNYSRKKAYWKYLRQQIVRVIQKHSELSLYRDAHEQCDSNATHLMSLASDYIHPSFHGEAILSVGKIIECIEEQHADGIINVMPFTCMPGTIVTAIMKLLRERYPHIPMITLSFAGQKDTALQTRLEAFMHQVRNRT